MTNLCPICSSPTFANGDCTAAWKHNVLQAHMILLPSDVEAYYAKRAAKIGKDIAVLIAADVVAGYKKRVAKEEKRVFKENEYERL